VVSPKAKNINKDRNLIILKEEKQMLIRQQSKEMLPELSESIIKNKDD
jgi:hypothetical protein